MNGNHRFLQELCDLIIEANVHGKPLALAHYYKGKVLQNAGSPQSQVDELFSKARSFGFEIKALEEKT